MMFNKEGPIYNSQNRPAALQTSAQLDTPVNQRMSETFVAGSLKQTGSLQLNPNVSKRRHPLQTNS